MVDAVNPLMVPFALHVNDTLAPSVSVSSGCSVMEAEYGGVTAGENVCVPASGTEPFVVPKTCVGPGVPLTVTSTALLGEATLHDKVAPKPSVTLVLSQLPPSGAPATRTEYMDADATPALNNKRTAMKRHSSRWTRLTGLPFLIDAARLKGCACAGDARL